MISQEKREVDFAYLLAHSEQALYNCQKEYEKSLDASIEARELCNKLELIYEYAYLNAFPSSNLIKNVTIAKEMAKKECFQQYSDWKNAEQTKKKFYKLTEKFEQRLNTIKAIMKINKNF